MARLSSRLCLGLLAAFAAGCGYEADLLPNPKLEAVFDKVVTLATQADIDGALVAENSYIVTFRSQASGLRAFASYLSEYKFHYRPLAQRYLGDPRVVDINYIDSVDLADPRVAAAGGDLDPPPALQLAFTAAKTTPVMGTIAEVSFRSNADAAAVLGEWAERGEIWFAEPNYLSYLSGVFGDLKTEYSANPLWWHEMLNLFGAFDSLEARNPPLAEQGVKSPVVAVLDSGLDVTHPAFENRLWVNPSPGQSGCQNDINGCDTTVAKKGSFGSGSVQPYGTSRAGEACNEEDEDIGKNCPHGTHVAGIIAAKYDAGSGYGGVCPFCRIMPIKIIAKGKGGGSAQDSAILNGLKYITRFTQNQRSVVRVINSSFGKYSRSRAVSVLVNVLSKSPNEILLIGAASNEDSMLRTYPASLANAVAVSALNRDGNKASYSNYGPWVDVAAPGGEGADTGSGITSTNPGGGPIVKSGTSMACPMTAGVAGLVLAIDPNRGFEALRNSIVAGAHQKIYFPDWMEGGANPGFNRNNYYPKIQGDNVRRPLLGSGVVDAQCAIENNCKNALPPATSDRVSAGCGVLGAGAGRAGGRELPTGLAWLALSLPFLSALVKVSRRRSR
jgi:hypothetical protein